jgi:hypothetical protein
VNDCVRDRLGLALGGIIDGADLEAGLQGVRQQGWRLQRETRARAFGLGGLRRRGGLGRSSLHRRLPSLPGVFVVDVPGTRPPDAFCGVPVCCVPSGVPPGACAPEPWPTVAPPDLVPV